MAALALMFVLVFIEALWYARRPEKRFVPFIIVCYLSCALPTIILNFLTNAASRSFLSLLMALVPAVIIWVSTPKILHMKG